MPPIAHTFEVPVAWQMSFTLTVQQRALRCRCGRYLRPLRWADTSNLTVQQRMQRCACGRLLAWSYRDLGTDQTSVADPVCCRCFQPSDTCRCAPTGDPAEGCHALDLEQVRKPDADDPDCE
jgi:hypothetical protein